MDKVKLSRLLKYLEVKFADLGPQSII